MPDLIPVEHDPFALNLLPVEYDPFVAPSGDGQFALGPTPKSGQTISVPDVLGEQRGIQGAVTSGLSNAFGLTDATRALRGEMTPEEAQNFALMGAAGIVAPEARGVGAFRNAAEAATQAAAERLAGKAIKFDRTKVAEGLPLYDDQQKVINVDPQALRRAYVATDPDFAYGLSAGKIDRLADYIDKGNSVAMPEVGVTDGRLGFTNGRHRAAIAAAMGMKEIPIVIDRGNEAEVRALISKYTVGGAAHFKTTPLDYDPFAAQ